MTGEQHATQLYITYQQKIRSALRESERHKAQLLTVVSQQLGGVGEESISAEPAHGGLVPYSALPNTLNAAIYSKLGTSSSRSDDDIEVDVERSSACDVACRHHLNFLRRVIAVNSNPVQVNSRWITAVPKGQLALVVQSTIDALFDVLLTRAETGCRQLSPVSLTAARSVTDAAAETIIKLTSTATDGLIRPDAWENSCNKGIRRLIEYVATSPSTSNASWNQDEACRLVVKLCNSSVRLRRRVLSAVVDHLLDLVNILELYSSCSESWADDLSLNVDHIENAALLFQCLEAVMRNLDPSADWIDSEDREKFDTLAASALKIASVFPLVAHYMWFLAKFVN